MKLLSIITCLWAIGTQAAPAETERRAVADGYWLNDLSGKGIAPFNPNPAAYKVFRNVKDYGARGMSCDTKVPCLTDYMSRRWSH
jgi:glucan 1,3-beta-glucosidase